MYFLNINKPKGISSFDVIRILRKKLNLKQIGHSGTLDPLASGVLQVAVGNATKLLNFLNSDKTYIAKMKFGFTSSTYDSEGKIEFIENPNFTKDELEKTLEQFTGKTIQTPPIYSAVKINGKKACDIARKTPQAEINIKPREIEIYSIKLNKFSYEETEIEVFCKKGVYIRSLVDDIGKKLNCGAYMTDLKRIKAGNFELKDSDELTCDCFRQINPIDCLNIRTLELNEKQTQTIKNGNFIKTRDNEFKDNEFLLLTNNNKVVSLAEISDNLIKPKKNFKEEEL